MVVSFILLEVVEILLIIIQTNLMVEHHLFSFSHQSIDFSSGLYFIDPNEGSKSDAILVYCKLTERLTCVNASHPLIQSNIFLNKLIPSQQRFQLMGDLIQPSEVMKEKNNNNHHHINGLFSFNSSSITISKQFNYVFFECSPNEQHRT